MITARNYAAQAERELSMVAEVQTNHELVDDVRIVKGIVGFIKVAQHFSLPENGKIFDDKLKGVVGQEIHLPYPCITIEYLNSNVMDADNGERINVKRLVVAIEMNTAEMEKFTGAKLNQIECDSWIAVFHSYAATDKGWMPGTGFWIMPCKWDQYPQDRTIITPGHAKREEAMPFVAGFAMFLPGTHRYCVKELGKDEAIESATQGVIDVIESLLELIEALSCSNVTHEPLEKINPAVNARRIRDGKLPLYETRCLVINAGKSVGDGGGIGGTHGSPRQHLRRGHIRRHPTAGNIWVNSCVVGSAELGVIDKQYVVM